MQRRFRTFLLALLLVSMHLLNAQSSADALGHWEGTIRLPDKELTVEVDLSKNQKGDVAGTISIPAQNLKHLPLRKVTVDGRSVNFQARAGQPFTGILSADGKSISGNLSVDGFPIPFGMTRTGEARINAPARLAPISRELEGTWEGVLEVNGARLRLVLAMSNQPGGAASASVVNLDEGGLEIPVSTITQAASTVSLDFEAIGGSYTGVLDKQGTEIAGTYRQPNVVAPLTFRRANVDVKKL